MPKLNTIKLFTKEQHVDILSKHSSNVDAAAAYNKLTGLSEPVVYRQMVKYCNIPDSFLTDPSSLYSVRR